jgi:hypothetical protein
VEKEIGRMQAGEGRNQWSSKRWRPFEEARAFVHDLGLRSSSKWREYAKSGAKPTDIPANPDRVYKGSGWQGYGDWLGTGRAADQLRAYRPFEEARQYTRSIGLKSQKAWQEWAKSDEKPGDIPASPEQTYKNCGWQGYGDWLGTGYVATQDRKYRPFEAAREYARGLGLRTQREWREHSRGGKKPPDIPYNPDRAYADAGWRGYGDFLGTGRVRGKGWRPYKEARAFVHTLGLKNQREWHEYFTSGDKPPDIPSGPAGVYKGEWMGFGDWLGTGYVAHQDRVYRPFEEAREYARSLGFESVEEWRKHAKSGEKPGDIPYDPHSIYKDEWVSYVDFLGGGLPRGNWRAFEEARAFVRTLGLRTTAEWRKYCKSGEKPDDIPADPREVYGDKWKRR